MRTGLRESWSEGFIRWGTSRSAIRILRAETGPRGGWDLEAAIPWESFGVKAPEMTVVLRGDIGILESDPGAIRTVSRCYWANKSNVVMGDLPCEARVIPSLWGELRFIVPDAGDLLEDMLKEGGGGESSVFPDRDE